MENKYYVCVNCLLSIPSHGMCITCSRAWEMGRQSMLEELRSKLTVIPADSAFLILSAERVARIRLQGPDAPYPGGSGIYGTTAQELLNSHEALREQLQATALIYADRYAKQKDCSKMKLFYYSNYGVCMQIIRAETAEQARLLSNEEVNVEIKELPIDGEPGIIAELTDSQG